MTHYLLTEAIGQQLSLAYQASQISPGAVFRKRNVRHMILSIVKNDSVFLRFVIILLLQ